MPLLTIFEFNVIGDLGRGNVQLDRVVHLDQWIGIAQSAAIVGHHERDVLGPDGHLLDLAQLVLGLLRRDTVDGEAALDVIDQTEELVGLLNGDHICKDGHQVNGGKELVVGPINVNVFHLMENLQNWPTIGNGKYENISLRVLCNKSNTTRGGSRLN